MSPGRRRRSFALPASLLGCLLAIYALAVGAQAVETRRDVVRMGYSTGLLYDVSLADAQAAMSLWVRGYSLTAGFSESSTAVIYDDLEEMAARVRAGALDFVAMSPLEYLRIQGETPLEPALVSLKGGRVADRQLLLAHRESGLRTLGDLRGKSLALLRSGDDLALLWLDTILAREGLPRAARFLGLAREGSRASQALLPVFFRRADACVVTGNAYATAVELNPQLGVDLVELEKSPEFPLGMMCLRADLDPGRKERILAASFQFLATPTGRQVLTLFKSDGVSPYRPGLLDELERLVREHQALAPVAKAEGER